MVHMMFSISHGLIDISFSCLRLCCSDRFLWVEFVFGFGDFILIEPESSLKYGKLIVAYKL